MTSPRASVLSSDWTLLATGGQVPDWLSGLEVAATVPGCVHTDLLDAGLIPDPYLDEHEAELSWIGRTSWRYATTVQAGLPAPGERIDLLFDGLDTVGEVSLNGAAIGSSRNMHRSHRFDLTSRLRPGANELVVDFAAQLDAAEQASTDQGPRVHTNAHPFNAVRKMACNFGWDWGPDLVTAGIWRPVRLHRWRVARLGHVSTLVTVEGGVGTVEVRADIVRDPDGPHDAPLRLRAEIAGTQHEVMVGTDHAVLRLEVPAPPLWWPRGHGEQPLFDLVVTLHQEEELDRHHRRVGFRSVELDTTPDDHGTAFCLRVNDTPILVKGANWIPDDCFPSRVDRPRYERGIDHAVAAGMNLLRVWGGGIYESDDFYDVCDEQGVLVWQDFLFACAAYAEEPPLRDEVVAEATEAVVRLGSHPSLVLWNGNNENLWGHVDWQWEEQLGALSWGRGYYLDVLPELVARLDPTRPYSPGSPWSFDEGRHPNDPAHGTMHIWDVWNTADYTTYRRYVPRFVSEFGYQGPPTWATLQRAVHDEPLTPTSPAMLSHQKAADGSRKLADGLAPHLDVPEDMDDWHWAMSLHQARAVGFGIEHFRSWQPVCAGMIVWQLNDCWPVTSWAAVDGDGRRKPLWYALRRAYADRLLTIQPRGDGLALAVCNDTDRPWQGVAAVRRMTLSGQERAVTSAPVTVAARSTHLVPLAEALVDGAECTDELLVARLDDNRTLWFFAEDRDLALVDGWKTLDAERTAAGYAVHVTADTLQRDVSLLVDRVDPKAEVDDLGITVLAGESHTFHVRSDLELDPAVFLDPRVLRTTNQLVHPDPGALHDRS